MERGGAAVILLCLLAAAMAASLLLQAGAAVGARERDAVTAAALARAHEALLAYAVAVSPDTAAKRPGDLPCPDLDNDGSAELTCAIAATRIGRLPWKTLDLSDLRDGSGERLWYALSGRFDRATANQCPVSGGPNCLNSDTPGSITVRDASGATLHDGSNPGNAAVAVVIAPGGPLQPVGGGSMQERDCSGDANPAYCLATRICSGSATALCSPSNYLDRMAAPVLAIAGAVGGAEDNATFADGDSQDGFVHGPIRDASGSIRLNDRLRVLRRSELMTMLERRVAGEALRCLRGYAGVSGARMPWAASVSTPFTGNLNDEDGTRFGRLPQALTATAGYPGMSAAWETGCPIPAIAPQHRWWENWKDQVLYAVAAGFAPDAPTAACGSCLAVNPPAGAPDKRVAVLVAGRALPGQIRGPGADASAYLEAGNTDGDDAFTQAPESATFNDRGLFE